MGCFFACFRLKEDDDRRKPHGISNSFPGTIREPVISKNQITPLFQCDAKISQTGQEAPLILPSNVVDRGCKDFSLKHEAKFLKSCGALLGTPAEIRSSLEFSDAEGLIHNFNSWLPSECCKLLHWEEETPLDLGTSIRETMEEQPCSAENKSSNSIEDRPQDDPATEVERQIPRTCPGQSCCATPLKLTDEMQTPATVYPSSVESYGTAKKARIRTQYVYPVSNRAENLAQWKEVRDPPVPSAGEFEQEGYMHQLLLTPAAPAHPKQTATLDLSLPQCPKPQTGKEVKMVEKSPSTDENRPIVGGAIAAMKWWDGKGIPNSTNKYKEDQKVSWHATPFELRLEKALCEGKISQKRKAHEGKVVEF